MKQPRNNAPALGRTWRSLLKGALWLWEFILSASILVLSARAVVAALASRPDARSNTLLLTIGLCALGAWRPAGTVASFILAVPLLAGLDRSGLLVAPNLLSIGFSGVVTGVVLHSFGNALVDLRHRNWSTQRYRGDLLEIIAAVLLTGQLCSAAAQWLRAEETLRQSWWIQSQFGFGDQGFFIHAAFVWCQGLAMFVLCRRLEFVRRLPVTIPLYVWSGSILLFFLLQSVLALPAAESVWAYVGKQHSQAFNAPFEDNHALGSICVMLFGMLVFDLIRHPQRTAGRLLLAISIAVVIGLSFSRAAWVTAGCTTALAVALRVPRRWAVSGLGLFLVGVTLANTLISENVWNHHSYFYRLHTLIRFEPPTQKLSSRLFMFKKSIGMMLERPFLGHGTGSHYLTSPRFAAAGDPLATKPEFAHNFILQSAAEMGLPFTVLLAVLLGWPVLWSLRSKRATSASRIAAVGVAAYVITQLTANSLNIYPTQQLMLWTLVAWASAWPAGRSESAEIKRD